MQQSPIIQIINMLVFSILLPVMIGAVYVHCQRYIQKGPKYRADRLEQFSRMSVQAVEYESPALSPAAKKQLAISRTATFFTQDRQVPPPVEAINTAVSAAMWANAVSGLSDTQKLSEQHG